MTDELKKQQIQFFVDSGEHCPVCCTECNYVGYHERDSTYDRWVCPKCKWECLVSDVDETDPTEYECRELGDEYKWRELL